MPKFKTIIGKILEQQVESIEAKIMFSRCEYLTSITFKDNTKFYFKGNDFSPNLRSVTEVVKDKDYCNTILNSLGFDTTKYEIFYSDHWCKIINSKRNTKAALQYAKKIGFPVYIKPNLGILGYGVSKVKKVSAFNRAAKNAFIFHRALLVQKEIIGIEYKFLIYKNHIGFAKTLNKENKWILVSTLKLHSSFRKKLIELVKGLGISLGVVHLISNVTTEKPWDKCIILEVNPSFSYKVSEKICKEETKILSIVCKDILKVLELHCK